MFRFVARVIPAIVASVVLLLALSAETASSASPRNSFNFGATSIDDVAAYAWASKGNSLVYATTDGTLWSVNPPAFATPTRIVRIPLPREHFVEQIVSSLDSPKIAVVSPRLNDLSDTIWLVDLKTSELRDLLPPGSPIGVPGTRTVQIGTWLPDGRIAFVLHCGTGCQGLHAVQTQGGEGYWDFCDASGPFFWSASRKDTVVQNDAEDVGPAGLGLLSASDGVSVATGASYYRPRRVCSSVFKGATRCGTCGPSQVEPAFNSWFPDNKTVLYTDEGLDSAKLKIWDTVSGSRKTLIADGSAGNVSPDGRYVSFISSARKTDRISHSKSALLAVMDLKNGKIIASSKVPALESPPQWSPSMGYLAGIARSDRLMVASFNSAGLRAGTTRIAVTDFSWSPDGKYLAVRETLSAPSKLEILTFPAR